MSKVYLLLRNNHQTGPHSLEELVQLGLKPLDLIWIEGKSFSWSYPSEISALKPYVTQSTESEPGEPATKEPSVASPGASTILHEDYMPKEKEKPVEPSTPPVKKIYVSLPGNMVQQQPPAQPMAPSQPAEPSKTAAIDLEQKADELRKRTQAYASANKSPLPGESPKVSVNRSVRPAEEAIEPVNKRVAEPIQTKYSRPVGELEEEYSSWICNQKSKKGKKVSWASMGAAIAVVVLLGAGFGISRYNSSGDEPVAVAEEPVITQELTDTGSQYSEDLIPSPQDQQAATPHVVPNDKPLSNTQDIEPERKENTSFASNNTPAAATKKEVVAPPKTAPVKESVPVPRTDEHAKENTAIQVEKVNKPAVKTKEPAAETTVETPAKKKSLGGALSGFFNKFKRKVDVLQDEEEPVQETRSGKQPVEKPRGTVQDPGTERKATRREETRPAEEGTKAAPAPAATNFEDLVDISSNEPAEKWMLGIHGLKVTIHNRSKETIRTAAVEVRYYSEQNELLEKKTVHFTNVPASKSATLPVPDHRLADHTEYRFLSANN